MSWGEADSLNEEQIEAWENDEWLLRQEMGEDYSFIHSLDFYYKLL